MCERNLCMFKHKKNSETEKDEETDEFEDQRYSIDDDETEWEDDEKLEDCVNERKDDGLNRTFSNPSQVNTSEKKFRCENCEFIAETKSDLNIHKTEIHNWCPACFSSFITQERLNLHISKKHSKVKKTDWAHHGESSW